jgi:hypothetical protein
MTALPPDIAGPPLLSDPRLVLAPNFKPLGFRMSLPDGERRIRVIPTVRRVCRTFLRELPYWEALIAAPELVSGEHTLAIGDFNTCRPHLDERGAIDPTAHYMDKIELIGYCDLGAAGIRRAASFRGTAPEATAFASTMLFYQPASPHMRARSATRMRSALLGSLITRL